MRVTCAILDFPAWPAARPAATKPAPDQTDGAPGADDGPAVLAPGRQVFERPADIIVARRLDEVRPALREVERSARSGAHAVGFVAYEAAPAFDAALDVRPHTGPAPLLWFAIFPDPSRPAAAAVAATTAVGAAAPAPAPAAARAAAPAAAPAPMPQLDWRSGISRDVYDRAIRRIRSAIEAGDVYQVNYTLQLLAACPPDCARTLYDALVAEGHGRFNALIETSDWSLISASPELFIDCADGALTTRPMKGTVRRGRWQAEDCVAARTLAGSAKDRAENLMIVDLLRNDLGRIAEFGSVRVPAMFDVESYPTVHQLTSTVTARLRAGLGLDDVFAAMFPCGSVTGAPKVTAMRTIAQLELSARGPYCGAIGVVRPDGSFTFNVAIRTMLLDRTAGMAAFGTGGGITWDSRAEDEFNELTAKAALVTERTPAFRLIETLRLDDVGYARLDGHLRRIAESARYWGFSDRVVANATAALEAERIVAAAEDERVIAAAALPADRPAAAAAAAAGAWRVRLTAGRNGDVEVTRTRIGDAPPRRIVCLGEVPVSRHDRLLFHKTTARSVHDSQRALYPDAFDILLWNEEGEVTEFTTGNVVALVDGALLTPSRQAGLLAGVFREQLLQQGRVSEAVITIDTIRCARRIWHVNSVRGCVRVTLAPTGKGQDPVLDPALPFAGVRTM